MKAMIFAAGNGTRLQPETNSKPKALVEINGKTLLQLSIEKLKASGFTEIVVNVHHFASQIVDYLNENNNFGIKIHISNESDELLDTGGGLLFAKDFFKGEKTVLIYNVDVLSDINLQEMMKLHKENKALATLAVRNRETQRKLLFNSKNVLSGWKNFATGEEIITRKNDKPTDLAFSGIHIIDTEIFKLIKSTGKFSIIKTYLELSKKHKIIAFTHNNSNWLDVGKPETLKIARQKK